jgi:hypothetical protein
MEDMHLTKRSKLAFSGGVTFSGMANSLTKTRSAVEAEKIFDMLSTRDYDRGGYFTEITGIMGSGKTGLELRMIKHILAMKTEELVFWRETLNSPFQAHKIGKEYQILCEKRFPIQCHEVTANMKPVDIEINYFSGFKQLMKLSDPSLLNVVYFREPEKWLSFIMYQRFNSNWQSFFFDEFEDVAPSRVRGEAWHVAERFAESIKEIRKNRVSVTYDTQSTQDVDFRIRSKLMVYIYLYGALIDQRSPVFPQAIQSLRVGDGYVDWGHSVFGKFSFKPMLPRERIYILSPIPTSDRKRMPIDANAPRYTHLRQPEKI